MLRSLALVGLLFGLESSALAQYTPSAGTSAPMEAKRMEVRDGSGAIVDYRTIHVKPRADKWGNAQGNQHDLAVDGAFKGQTVAVLHLYVDSMFDFSLPKAALAEKGFSTYRWIGTPPSPDELAKSLEKSSQLWLISGSSNLLTPEHVKVIKRFFDAGHGVYIWGDNEPYYADANVVARELLGTTMHGNLMGDQTVGMLSSNTAKGGVRANHLLTTGLEHIFEGITIATIEKTPNVEPLIYGSAGNLVAAYYDKDGKRAILDGGFTRLYIKWDTAGTARYVKNAASWLVNAERFGDAVINPEIKKMTPVTSVPTIAMPEPAVEPSVAPTTANPSTTAPASSPLHSTRMGYILIALFAGLFVLLYLPRRFR